MIAPLDYKETTVDDAISSVENENIKKQIKELAGSYEWEEDTDD